MDQQAVRPAGFVEVASSDKGPLPKPEAMLRRSSSSTMTAKVVGSNTSAATAIKESPSAQQAILAVQQGDFEEVKALVESGAVSVEWKDPSSGGASLLHWAAINGRMDVVDYLVSKQADINAVGGALKDTSLQWAARQVSDKE